MDLQTLQGVYTDRSQAQPERCSPLITPLRAGRISIEALQVLVDDLPEQVALLDDECTIVAVNYAWTQTMAALGYSGVAVGDSYRTKCQEVAAERYAPAVQTLAALDDITSGKIDAWKNVFNGRGKWSDHEYEMTFHRVSVGDEKLITITRSDRTGSEALRRESNGAERADADSASAERQRLTRELHDSTSQLLVGTNLLLGCLKRKVADADAIPLINELQELVREIEQEVRSVAYLARPPALETLSFAEALQELIEGFGARSGITTTVSVSGNGNIPRGPAENSLYRIVQEALSNILRHARASEASVSMIARKGMTHLVIRDNGRGICPSAARGVGVSGMRARMTELKGKLTIRALSPGTAVVASLRA